MNDRNNRKTPKIKKQHKRLKKVLIALAVTVAVCGACGAGVYTFFKADSIEYVGSGHYSDEELKEYIFGSDYVNTLCYWLFDKKSNTIPFVQKYDVEIEWPNKLYVTVYEKPVVGYVEYMGCNMYFDKDGMVVESSTQLYENVPEIDGLKFDSIVLGSKLEVGSDEIFEKILELTQSFDKYEVDIDKVYFDSSYNIYLYMGDVKISLGVSTDYSDKLYVLKQLSAEFGSLKGTLYLDEYDGSESSIIFKREK